MPTNIRRLQLATPDGTRPIPAPWTPGWRAMLETRWKARLQQVTEEALAYHEAAAAAGRDDGEPRLRELLRRVVTARRELADTEEALARLSAGSYGHCE